MCSGRCRAQLPHRASLGVHLVWRTHPPSIPQGPHANGPIQPRVLLRRALPLPPPQRTLRLGFHGYISSSRFGRASIPFARSQRVCNYPIQVSCSYPFYYFSSGVCGIIFANGGRAQYNLVSNRRLKLALFFFFFEKGKLKESICLTLISIHTTHGTVFLNS